MSGLSAGDLAKLATLSTTARPRVAEIVVVYWPAPDGQKNYASSKWTDFPGFGSLTLTPIEVRLIPDQSSPLLTLPRAASISDDSIDLAFNDLDDELSRLTFVHGEGVRVEVLAYYPEVDLLLSQWRGALRTPKDSDQATLKIQATAGFRSPQMVIPRRLLSAPSCQLMFAGLLATQDQIDRGKCPYNFHLGGSIGVADPSTGLPWTDCKRDSVATCIAHLDTDKYFGGGGVVIESVANNQTKGPNLLATTVGNTNAFSDPIRVFAGSRHVSGLRVIAFAPEPDTRHPDQGFVKVLCEVGEGPLASLYNFRINDVLVGFQHLNVRLGTIGQGRTAFSPSIGNYSGTALCFGRIQGNFNNVSAGDLSGSVDCQGLSDIRVYTDETTFNPQYSTNRLWWILRMLTDQVWGFGNDIAKYDISQCIETAKWCDEFVRFQDPNGTIFSGTRSTFNAELTARSTQQQITDACTAGRLGLPFEFNGKEVLVPLRKELVSLQPTSFTNYTFSAVLARTPTSPELAAWTGALSGAGVLASAKTLVLGLLSSAEYVARARTDVEFISDLYQGFFQHNSDDTGFAFWLANLAGSTRAAVALAFADSQEFQDIVTGANVPLFTDYTDDDFAQNIVVKDNKSTLTRTIQSDSVLVNQWTVSFDDASNNFTSVSLIVGDMTQQLKAGKAWGDTSIRIINKNQPAFGITNQSEAMRFANTLLYLGPLDSGGLLNNLQIKFTTWWKEALNVRNYKLIKVRSHKLERYGFDYFRVTNYVRKGDLTVEITAQAYPVDFYDQMESIAPPPIPSGGPLGNPGGGPLDIPCDIGFTLLHHLRDRVEFTLENC